MLGETALGKDLTAALKHDEAAPALWTLLRSAELDGHEPRRLLTEAVESRELRSSDSVAKVLYYRVERILANERVPETDTRGRHAVIVDPRSAVPGAETRQRPTFTERTPAPEGLEFATSHAAYARQLAQVMDQRRSELGDKAARERPQWAEQLGVVPDEAFERAEWSERAASVAAYREQYGYESPSDPIGPAPPRGADPQRRIAWDEAWRALGRPDKDRDVASRSDGELVNLVETYRREETWSPPYVGDELREAHLLARHWRQRADVEAAERRSSTAARDQPEHSATPPDEPQRHSEPERPLDDEQQAQPATAERSSSPTGRSDPSHEPEPEQSPTRRFADTLATRAEQLEEVDAARRAWHDHTADTREQARQARAELGCRHPDSEWAKAPEAGQATKTPETPETGAHGPVTATVDLTEALEKSRQAHEIIAGRHHEETELGSAGRDYVRRRTIEQQQQELLLQLDQEPTLSLNP